MYKQTRRRISFGGFCCLQDDKNKVKSDDFTLFLFDIIKRVAAVGAECYAQNSSGIEMLAAVRTFAPEEIENGFSKKNCDEQDDT